MSDLAYDPALYDVVHDERAADVAWYAARATASGGPVLELGAGTGRTLLPVARAGVAIWGLEKSDAMRAALEARVAREPPEVRARVHVVAGDMEHFALGAQFAFVQIPFRAFLHNVTRDAQRACFAACRAHLRPGGTLAFNVFHPSLAYMAQYAGAFAGAWRLRSDRATDDGGRLLISETVVYRTAEQRLDTCLRYERFGPDGRLATSQLQRLELAYLYPGDVRELLAGTGFDDVTIEGGFAGGAFARDGDKLVITARRSA